MSILFQRSVTLSDVTDHGSRGYSRGWGSVNRRTALRHSAVWAATRVRADLISTMPIDVFRKTAFGDVEVAKPPVLINPSGEKIDITEWMYNTQVDLDLVGNTFGIITEKDGSGKPRRIDLVPREEVVVEVRGGVVGYRIAGEHHVADMIWHERQHTSSGLALGLSPIAYAAMSILQHRGAQDFATNWFAGGAIPSAILKNDNQKVDPRESAAVKARFKLAVENGDMFVVGKDWDYNVIEAQNNQASFLDTMKLTDIDIARYTGVPADVIDAERSGSSITYANVVQAHLRLLIINIGPAVTRREKALSRMVVDPRYVKLKSDALLRMDPETAARVLGQKIKDRVMTPSEVRALDNLPPFTDAQLDEFKTLFPNLYSNAGAGGVVDDAQRARAAAELIQKVYLGVGKVLTADEARDLANRAGAALSGTFPVEGAPE